MLSIVVAEVLVILVGFQIVGMSVFALQKSWNLSVGEDSGATKESFPMFMLKSPKIVVWFFPFGMCF